MATECFRSVVKRMSKGMSLSEDHEDILYNETPGVLRERDTFATFLTEIADGINLSADGMRRMAARALGR